ncbi:MAG: NfeD family protein [Bryobacterales bacterium]|nr:NfeD family protein [Bryobacterales bacterium]MBV9401949.1 NfeD family protein [Bryobacterales bacterium]
MNWETFYLTTFMVGFLLSLASVLAGTVHSHGPHLHGHGHGNGNVLGRGGRISRFNFAAITAFLAWFGGTGYLLEHYAGVWVYLGLLVACAAGMAGASLVLWFVAKLTAHENPMNPVDYDMVGVLGRVSSPIRRAGTGEVLYLRDGARKCVPARSEDFGEVARDTEVIVTRYEKGIAYVRRWEDVQ